MRITVASLLLLTLCGVSMGANIVVDGVVDYGAYCIIQDATNDCRRTTPTTEVGDMVEWGVAVDRSIGSGAHGTLYGYIKMDTLVSHYDNGGGGMANDIFGGFWIDADFDSTTDFDTTGNFPAAGTDLMIEWGVNTSHFGMGFMFWGADTGSGLDVDNPGSVIDNKDRLGAALPGAVGGTAYSGYVMEFACDIAEANDEFFANWGAYPAAAWRVGARALCHEPGTGWMGDLGLGGADVGNGVAVIVPQDPSVGGKLGDYNYDGATDAADLTLMTKCNYSAIDNALMDFDGDDDVDNNDVVAILSMGVIDGAGGPGLSTFWADLDLDGDVDSGDYTTLSLNWNQTGGKGWHFGDLNGDDTVDSADYTTMSLNWGRPPAIPEPVTLSLLPLAGVALLHRRK